MSASFDEVATALEHANAKVSRGQMFGMPVLKHGRKAFAGLHGDDMVFRIPDEQQREQALRLPGAKRFEPMRGRQMKEWVQVPKGQSDLWLALANAALVLRAP